MSDSPKYKRRTFDECKAMALGRFKAEAQTHLSPADYEHCLKEACLNGGGPRPGWRNRLGFDPEERMHYELRIDDWAQSDSPGCPPPKCWVRFWSVVTALATFALFGGRIMKTVSNDRTSDNGAPLIADVIHSHPWFDIFAPIFLPLPPAVAPLRLCVKLVLISVH